MNLVSSLIAGIGGAENGWAEVCVRGTSVRATWYGDFEASTSNSSGDNITLDAYGAAEVYVNQLVDIVAKSPDGTVVRSWTDGYSSPNVEVISPAFTGHDYVSGVAAVNEPTTLQAVLDLWATNSGAPDWKVSVSGSPTTLGTAIGSLNGLVFNVKSPQFGAVGNGVANDQTAIQAALAAAIAVGGGTVFFPAGTYLIATAMEWDQRVSMAGIGSGASVIATNSASNARILQFTSGSTPSSPFKIYGMAFSAMQPNTGTQMYSSVGMNVIVENCFFGASANATGICADFAGTPGRLIFRDCLFLANGNETALRWININRVVVDSCNFKTSQTAYTNSLVKAGSTEVFFGCLFDTSSVTALGAYYCIEETLGSGALLSVLGCRFVDGSSLSMKHIKALSAAVYTQGNLADGGMKYALSGAGTLDRASRLQLYSYIGGVTIIPDGCEETQYTGGAPTFTMPNGFYEGQPLTVLLRNNSGGAWTPAFTGAVNMPGVTIPNMTAGNGGVVKFLFSNISGSYAWRTVYAVGS